MNSYGYLIVRNPGPDTEIQIGGLNGYSDSFVTEDDAYNDALREAKPGDLIRVLIVGEDRGFKAFGHLLQVRDKPGKTAGD